MAGVDPSSLHPTPVPVAHTPVSATLLPSEKPVGTKSHSPGVPKALCQGSLTPAPSSPAWGQGPSGWGRLCCPTPARQQPRITCAGKRVASCSILASSHGDVRERFWPAAQPRCPHPAGYPPAHKEEGSSVLFLGSIAQAPLRSTPHLSLAPSPACSAQTRRRGLRFLPQQTRDPSAQRRSGCRIGSRLSPSTAPGC